MAVRIDIPNVGAVIAENAASEETLRDILDAMVKAGVADGSAREKENKAIDKGTKSKKANTDAVDQNTKETSKANLVLKTFADQIADSGKKIGLTFATMAAKFVTQAAQMAEDPIAYARDTMNTAIDVVSDVTQGFSKMIPIIGDGIAALEQVAADVLKIGNVMFAEQLQKNVKALQDYAKVGVSFTGGMMQMQQAANAAGLGIADFSKIVTQSRSSLNFLGKAGGDSAQLLSEGLGAAVQKIGKSGQNLRTEMFKMGYTYEEQGEIMSEFMANMAASGKLRSMSDEQIAIGTREYAKNLKVISDITGQDAKKLMEKARNESMRAGLMNKLQGDQKDAFMQANSMLGKFGPEVQNALTQFLSIGTITDPAIAANDKLRTLIESVGTSVQAGSKNIIDETNRAMSSTIDGLKTSGSDLATAVDKASIAGFSGPAADMAKIINQILASSAGMDPEAAKRSSDAAERTAASQEGLAKETAHLYDETKKFAVTLEQTINPNLEAYAGYLVKLNEATLTQVKKAITAFGGQGEEAKYATELDKTLAEAIKKLENIDKAEKEAGKGWMDRYITDRSDERNAATKAIEEATQALYKATGRSGVQTVPQYADGGIATGPKSGYPAVLHGTEAIVPLEKNPKNYPPELKKALMDMHEMYAINRMMYGGNAMTGAPTSLPGVEDGGISIPWVNATSEEDKAVLNKTTASIRETIKKYVDMGVISGREAVEQFAAYDYTEMQKNKAKEAADALAATSKYNSGSFADGGVSSGPTSGYSATLHGTEAVVPLPNNKSIPVSLDSNKLETALQEQSGILNQILQAMKQNNSISSGILQANY